MWYLIYCILSFKMDTQRILLFYLVHLTTYLFGKSCGQSPSIEGHKILKTSLIPSNGTQTSQMSGNEKLEEGIIGCFKKLGYPPNDGFLYCNTTFDLFLCWPPAKAGEVVPLRCPPVPGVDPTKYAYRKCSLDGRWEGKSPTDTTMENGWTNYSGCYTPETKELLRDLYSISDDDAKMKMIIANATRIMEIVGLALSLVSLLISLFIFSYYRSLKNNRTRIHRHLFIAIMIQVIIRLTIYTDQEMSGVGGGSGYISSEKIGHIHRTKILCEAFYALLEYARTAMFMWMFIEGLYLHNMIAVAVFTSKPNYWVYYLIGWGAPVIMTSVWVGAMVFGFDIHSKCWYSYNLHQYYWILEGPRLTVIIANLLFLLNIIRVLITKLQESNSSEAQQVRKAVKAAIVLLPLLGITNFIGMVKAPLRRPYIEFGFWSFGANFLISFQGFFIAMLYCFLNGEVRSTILKQWRRYSVRRDPRSGSRRRLSRSLSTAMYTTVTELRDHQGGQLSEDRRDSSQSSKSATKSHRSSSAATTVLEELCI
uniref:Pigment-dispersing factor receptor n=1 Tax=Euperipatoides rowelli TaxID=49087 RepID=A0A6M9E8M4_EUPRO|nr:pigment-dispersing factor receptor [Euperipatoides rowelli]